MFNLGKKLSSVLLCGSMAVTLLGDSGVHAADEVTAVDEHDEKVENDDEGKEYQYVKKEDITAQNPAERSGSSFAANAAKGLGTVALGVGMGVGAEEGLRRIRKGSSGNEAGGQAQAPIASKDGTKIEELESQVSELQKKLEGTKIGVRELQKKLEENEKIFNFLYGAIGAAGYIPQLRDMVSSKLGRDFDVESKAAITGMFIAHGIGIVLLFWNLIKLFNKATKPNSIKGGVYTAVKMLTDLALPPVGFILRFAEMFINEFKGSDVNNVNMIEDADDVLYNIVDMTEHANDVLYNSVLQKSSSDSLSYIPEPGE